MRLTKAPSLAVVVVVAMMAGDALAQDLHPSRRLSPVGIARTHMGDTYMKVIYGRPYMRGREIFGTNTEDATFLVPFGEVWRTGASEATELTSTGPIVIAGNALDAGTYSIFTEPGQDEWVIHINSLLGLDGTGIFDQETQTFTPMFDAELDLATFSVPTGMIEGEEPVDQFTIEFEEVSDGVHLVLRWEMTEIRIPITAG